MAVGPSREGHVLLETQHRHGERSRELFERASVAQMWRASESAELDELFRSIQLFR